LQELVNWCLQIISCKASTP